jgi:hypothetical protein
MFARTSTRPIVIRTTGDDSRSTARPRWGAGRAGLEKGASRGTMTSGAKTRAGVGAGGVVGLTAGRTQGASAVSTGIWSVVAVRGGEEARSAVRAAGCRGARGSGGGNSMAEGSTPWGSLSAGGSTGEGLTGSGSGRGARDSGIARRSPTSAGAPGRVEGAAALEAGSSGSTWSAGLAGCVRPSA